MTKDRSKSRREFLKTGAAGIAGAAFLSTCSRPGPPEEKPQKEGGIVYRTLGRTGLRLPVVSMGSSYAIALLRTAHDEGIVNMLRAWRVTNIACNDCSRCEIRCSLGHDVKSRALDMARLLEGPEDLLYQAGHD